jgi:hypothetical protein
VEHPAGGACALDALLVGRQSGGVAVRRFHRPRDRQTGAQKNTLKPWLKKQWCIPEVSAGFVAALEDVPDLYAEEYDEKRPVVCFDETSKQLIKETRQPLSARAGAVERFDYEYQRNGVRNLFPCCEPRRGGGTSK